MTNNHPETVRWTLLQAIQLVGLLSCLVATVLILLNLMIFDFGVAECASIKLVTIAWSVPEIIISAVPWVALVGLQWFVLRRASMFSNTLRLCATAIAVFSISISLPYLHSLSQPLFGICPLSGNFAWLSRQFYESQNNQILLGILSLLIICAFLLVDGAIYFVTNRNLRRRN